MARASIPDDLPWISPFVENTLRAQRRTRALIEEAAAGSHPPGSDRQRIADLYRSYADEAAIERAGLAPLATELVRIAALRSAGDLATTLARLGRSHASTDPGSGLPDVVPVIAAVRADAHDASRPIATLLPVGLGLPDRSCYLDPGERAETVRAAYQRHIADTLRLSGLPDADRAAERVVALETSFARAQLSDEQLHDPAATSHPTSPDDLERLYPKFRWRRFLQAAGVWGRARTQRREPVGRLYVGRYLEAGAKRDVTAMAEQVRAAFAARIRSADWLEPTTMAAALDKVGKLLIKVAYPDRWQGFRR